MTEFRAVEGESTPSPALPGLTVLLTRFAANLNLYEFTVETSGPKPNHCMKCGSFGQINAFGRLNQRFHDTDIQGRHVQLLLKRRRYRCKVCKATSVEPILAWAHENRRATDRFVRAVERDALQFTNTHVARMYGLDEKTVKNMLTAFIEESRATIQFVTPEWLGMDEIHIGGRPRAILMNIGEETIIDILDDRSRETVLNFFLQAIFPTQVNVVSMSPWQPYRDAVRETMPHAVIVVDQVHVVRLIDDAFSQIRRACRAGLSPQRRRKLRHDNAIFLQRRRDLTASQAEAVERWKRDFPELIAAYDSRDQFHGLYDCTTADEARGVYQAWLQSIPESQKARGGPWYDLVTAMSNWEDEVMGYFQHRVTTAYTESVNTIIRDLDRQGRGYSFEALRARVLYGQRYWKKDSLSSVAMQVKSDPASGGYGDEPETLLIHGVDVHLLAADLGQHEGRKASPES